MKFECQAGCGKCCVTGGTGNFVFLTSEDIAIISRETGMKWQEFAKQSWFDYTRFSPKKTQAWHLSESENSCRFYKDSKCTIYKSRPTQCRTFPFWPEHMPKASWDKLAEVCPGINKGDEISPSIPLREQQKADKLCRKESNILR